MTQSVQFSVTLWARFHLRTEIRFVIRCGNFTSALASSAICCRLVLIHKLIVLPIIFTLVAFVRAFSGLKDVPCVVANAITRLAAFWTLVHSVA